MPGPPTARTGDGSDRRHAPRPGSRTARETLASGYLNTSDLAAAVSTVLTAATTVGDAVAPGDHLGRTPAGRG